MGKSFRRRVRRERPKSALRFAPYCTKRRGQLKIYYNEGVDLEGF